MNRKSRYDEADWSQSDKTLAIKFGVSRQAIAAARKVRGIKPAVPHGGDRKSQAYKKSDDSPT